jgi:hypothetical protein
MERRERPSGARRHGDLPPLPRHAPARSRRLPRARTGGDRVRGEEEAPARDPVRASDDRDGDLRLRGLRALFPRVGRHAVRARGRRRRSRRSRARSRRR